MIAPVFQRMKGLAMRCFAWMFAASLLGIGPGLAADRIGLFSGSTDVGVIRHPGRVEHDAAAGSYAVAGSGANMWFTNDALHFVWTKVSGDVWLAADVRFLGTGGDPHRKACLLVRQSLEPGSAYADAVVHGDGLTSLQYREVSDERTYEIQSSVNGPRRLRIEKVGEYISMSIAEDGEGLRPAGGSFRLRLEEPYYVGLGVCAHNADRIETAVFSNVELKKPAAVRRGAGSGWRSTLETVPLASKDRRVVLTTTNRLEAPRWSADAGSLFVRSRGGVYRVPVAGGELEPAGEEVERGALPRSPGPGPRGYVYGASAESGSMQVWRVKWNGTGRESLTDDAYQNTSPQVSPDGRWVLVLSYDRAIRGVPRNVDVTLRLISLEDRRVEVLAKLLGGEGTVDLPCWSPDSRRVAFVSYQPR